jgi:hypothetical protein
MLMKRSKEQVKKDLNLSELPSDEFMALLDEIDSIPVEVDEHGFPQVKVKGLTPYSTKPHPAEAKSWTPDEIREVLTKESGVDFRKMAEKK